MKFTQKIRARIAIVLLSVYSIDLCLPISVFAISGGPTQPEFVGFSPVSASNLVDPFTGDVSYNIPLFEIGGYPINLAYSGASNMEADASWVGFGWTLNPGAINRDVRGVPDDFKGDEITRNVNLRKNWTVGVSGNATVELLGKEKNKTLDVKKSLKLGFSLTVTYNNYNGLGIEQGLNISASIGKKGGTGFSGGLGISNGPSGFSANSNLGLKGQKENVAGSIGIAGGFNSRSGLNEMSITANVRPVVDAAVTKHTKDANGTITSSETKMKEFDFEGMADAATASSTISFGHTPAFRMSQLPLLNRTYTYRATVGFEAFGSHPGLGFRGFYNEQDLATKQIIKPAYGCLYSESASEDAITDYSVEKDVPLTNTTTNLPLPYMTSDMYGVMAHGIGGQFRIKRSDNGVFHQSETTLEASGLTVGVEAGGGNLFHGGADITTPTIENNSGQWINSNTISQISPFKTFQNATFIPAYFYNNSETQLFPFNEGELTLIQPILPKSQKEGKKLAALSTYSNNKAPSDYEMDARITNKTVLTYLTAEEASNVGLQKSLNSYPANRIVFGNFNSDYISSISRLSHPEHHISEITVTKEDGMRYIFGLPAYNKIKRESTFNLGDPDFLPNTEAYALYTPNQDNSINNRKGIDYFFDENVTPEYATSYLLTAVATPNYVDITGNGISSDDIGDIVQFNYTRVYADYKWRTPYDLNSVNHNPGHKVVTDDSKGSFIYGEKEVWLNHSIESKDQIAIFYSSATQRKDAIEPQGLNGGRAQNPRRSYQLDSIAVFSKAELLAHPENPTPIKTVVFKYDFSLFPNAPNTIQNGTGKLTLKQVYFTYGKNYKGRLNPYMFEYNNRVDGEIVEYQLGATDRWGGIKLNNNTTGLPLDQYPYVEQDKLWQDQYASLGQLKSIQLPSGALIEIEYESDDYAYVNDLPAATMMMIAGVGKTEVFQEAGKSELNELSLAGFQSKPYIFFEIPEYISDANELYEKYFEGILRNSDKQLYFDFALDLNDESIYDRVKGYFNYVSCGIYVASPTEKYGWVKISPVADQENNYHPATLAGLQKLRLEIPQKAYPQSYIPPGDINVLTVATNIGTNMGRMLEELVGFNLTSTLAGKCSSIDVSSSWIRLKDPDGTKLGGGSRVKKVSISDLINHQYYKLRSGQKYEYKITDDNSPRNSFSSGVASYEPMLGGEENPARMVIASVEKVKLAPDNFYYSELPMGEQLFPAPSVGYSQIKITPFGGLEDEEGIGYEVKRFYTALDYPTYTLQTDPVIHSSLNTPMKMFNFNRDTYFSALQGYTVVVNDMHGKPKTEESYNKNQSLISKTEYFYDNMTSGTPKRSVSNKVDVVDSKGNISEAIMGVDMEVYQEYSEASTTSSTPGLMGNLDVFAVPWPLPVPVPLNLFSRSTQTTRTGCVTKFIKKAGILKKVKTTNEYGAVSLTENLLFDKETGTMVLNSTTNNFGDKLYTLNMPAYWGYSKMGPATKDLGLVFTNVALNLNTDFSYISNSLSSIIEEGAEFYVKPASAPIGLFKKYYLLKDVHGARVVDDNNQPLIPGNYDLKIIRSGRKNLLGQNLQTITSRLNPINYSANRLDIGTMMANNVLNSSAIEFDDYSKIKCNEFVDATCNSIFGRHNGTPEIQDKLGYFIDALIHYSRFYEGQPIISTNALLDWFEEKINSEVPPDLRTFLNQYFLINNIPEPNGTPWIKVNFGPNCFIDIRPRGGIRNGVFTGSSSTFIGIQRDQGPVPNIQNINEINNYGNPPDFQERQLFNQNEDYATYDIMYKVGRNITTELFRWNGTAVVQCYDCSYSCEESLEIGQTINPYSIGVKGNWTPFKAYTFMGERSRPMNEEATNLSNDGYLQNWQAFWQFDPNSDNRLRKASALPSNLWVAPNQITLKDNRGNTLEEKDAINRYSSAIFSYDNNFNTAVASNARYQNIANDHFEDYDFKNDLMERCFKPHWNFKPSVEGSEVAAITNEAAHSGIKSLKLLAQSEISVRKDLNNTLYLDSLSRDEQTKRYLLNYGDCLKEFSPTAGQQYIISGWIKPNDPCKTNINNAGITVDLNGELFTFKPAGPTIDGWQKVEGIFEVNSSATFIDVQLFNEENIDQFFDDIRIHPLNSNMKCFVYHPENLKLMATLDENNYASFYEYDAEGKLVRIKKETERGIVTLKENRQQLYRPTN